MSGDIEQDYFADGISEDIITALSRLRWLFVLARNSSFAYKGRPTDVRQVARDLDVRYVLEGSVRKSGDKLRVTSQLIDATNGTHVWAERYDRSVSDIFAVQDEITSSVVASIEPQLYAAENLRFQSKPDSLDAWSYVTRAMPHVWSWSGKDNNAAIELLERATAIDPNYARATGLLGLCYACRSHFGWADPGESLGLALPLARKAIEQDGEDPWAHLALGFVHMVSRQAREARDDYSNALALNPSFAFGHALLGNACGYGGDAEEGLRNVSMAIRLSPRDQLQGAYLSITGLCHLIARRYAEAVDFERRAVQLRPSFATAWRTLAAAAGQLGDIALGRSAVAEIRRLQPDLTLAWVEEHYPLVRPEDMEMYLDGLRRSGLT